MKPEIAEFARLLISEVRDKAIRSCDMNLRPEINNAIANRWRDKLTTSEARELAATMIPDCVDDALATLMAAIDQEMLQISFTASNGNVVDLTDEGKGELCGWYMGSDGWRSRYTKERYIDDFEHLKDMKWDDVDDMTDDTD